MPDGDPHPFVRLFAAQQQQELDVARQAEERETMARAPEDEHDVVADGRLDAPHVQGQFRAKAQDHEAEVERALEPAEAEEARVPEEPLLVLRPPFVLDIEREAHGAPAARGEVPLSLAERRRLAQEMWEGQERGGLSETFANAKLRSLAKRRFNAAAKDLDYGQER